MDRTINVNVNGEFVKKDSKNAGTQGEANVTTLHIVFSAEWEEFSKRIIWRNALGEDPVSVLLTHSVEELLDGQDPLAFDTPIPAEPMAEAGWCSFTIEGFRDSTPTAVSITVTDYLLVKPNDAYGAPKEPTPTQAQQLQVQIDGIVPQVTEAVQAAVDALNQAEEAVKVWEVWDPSTKYLPLQKVYRLGSSYICITTNVGVDPALDVPSSTGEGSFWQLIAQKGDKGEQGPAGPQGLTGAQGIQGPRGLTGERGPQGIQGNTGPQGIQGKDGPSGPQGPAGPQGIQGERGQQGPQGATGARGATGAKGETGATGAQGPQGIRGERGERGLQGQQGPQGPQGVQGPEGPRGIDGVAVATAGMVAFNVNEDGHLLCSYTGEEQPDYYINEEGHLCLDI